MITVLQFITSLSDGGAETLVKDYGILFKQHPELNVRCVIVTLHCVKNSANYQRLKNSGVEIASIYERHNKFISLHRKLFGSWYVPRKILEIINKYNPTAVHVHLHMLKYFYPINKKLRDIKLFYTCHNEPSVMFGHNNGELESAEFLIKSNNLQMIALHDVMRVQLNEKFGVDNTIVINNGVNFFSFKNVEDNKIDIRKNIGIPENAFVVGHIGRFNKQKNHLFLLRIFSQLLKIKDNSFLLLIGSGPMKDLVIQEAKKLKIFDKIVFLSNRTDVPQLLKSMDVFLFPSLYEGLSVTLVEAQVSGLRCIISDKIKQENVLVDTTIQVSLESSTDQWCETILDSSRKNSFHNDLRQFDMNQVIKKLSVLYNSK